MGNLERLSCLKPAEAGFSSFMKITGVIPD